MGKAFSRDGGAICFLIEGLLGRNGNGILCVMFFQSEKICRIDCEIIFHIRKFIISIAE